MAERIPHPANAPGDFYVEDRCCTMCAVPFVEAPKLFGRHEESEGYQHCFVKRQPQTRIELEQMVSAVSCAELNCIRYRGHDPLVLSRLYDANALEICDNPSPELRASTDHWLC
jgi:hypothetical protein